MFTCDVNRRSIFIAAIIISKKLCKNLFKQGNVHFSFIFHKGERAIGNLSNKSIFMPLSASQDFKIKGRKTEYVQVTSLWAFNLLPLKFQEPSTWKMSCEVIPLYLVTNMHYRSEFTFINLLADIFCCSLLGLSVNNIVLKHSSLGVIKTPESSITQRNL